VAEWARVYRDELVAMDSISLLDDRRARNWNRHVDRMQRAHLELRKSLEGRAAITAMISDRVRTVAHWSAAHALFWDEVSHVPTFSPRRPRRASAVSTPR
jgi:hypothetical protein